MRICDALRDLVPFVQFKKREKRPWRSVNLLKVTLLRGRFSRFSYCTNVPNGAKHQILIHVYFHFAWRKCISTYFQLNHDKHTGKCALKVLTFEILKDKQFNRCGLQSSYCGLKFFKTLIVLLALLSNVSILPLQYHVS